jgi:anti-sigma factor RsiW
MNCAVVRSRLPALVYDDLPADVADEVRRHLASCASCAKKHAEVAQVRRRLDAVPVPAVAVDLPRLYREAAEQQARRLRRWRRVACAALAAAAAVVAVVFLSRLEVRIDNNQLVLRWGAVPAPPDVLPPTPPVPQPEPPPIVVAAAPSADVEQQLRLLSELVQALSDDADRRDGRRQHEIARLRAQMQSLQQQMAELRLATAKDVSALYAAQVPERQKGASQ